MRHDARLPSYVTLEAKQGDDTTLRAVYTDDAGDPIDLTGYGVEFSIAPRGANAPAITHARDDPAITVTDAEGIIEAILTAADTRAFGNNLELVAELTVTTPGPNARRVTLADFLITLRREAVDETVEPPEEE